MHKRTSASLNPIVLVSTMFLTVIYLETKNENIFWNIPESKQGIPDVQYVAL